MASNNLNRNELLIVSGIAALLYVWWKGGSAQLGGVLGQAVAHAVSNPIQTVNTLQNMGGGHESGQ